MVVHGKGEGEGESDRTNVCVVGDACKHVGKACTKSDNRKSTDVKRTGAVRAPCNVGWWVGDRGLVILMRDGKEMDEMRCETLVVQR